MTEPKPMAMTVRSRSPRSFQAGFSAPRCAVRSRRTPPRLVRMSAQSAARRRAQQTATMSAPSVPWAPTTKPAAPGPAAMPMRVPVWTVAMARGRSSGVAMAGMRALTVGCSIAVPQALRTTSPSSAGSSSVRIMPVMAAAWSRPLEAMRVRLSKRSAMRPVNGESRTIGRVAQMMRVATAAPPSPVDWRWRTSAKSAVNMAMPARKAQAAAAWMSDQRVPSAKDVKDIFRKYTFTSRCERGFSEFLRVFQSWT